MSTILMRNLLVVPRQNNQIHGSRACRLNGWVDGKCCIHFIPRKQKTAHSLLLLSVAAFLHGLKWKEIFEIFFFCALMLPYFCVCCWICHCLRLLLRKKKVRLDGWYPSLLYFCDTILVSNKCFYITRFVWRVYMHPNFAQKPYILIE